MQMFSTRCNMKRAPEGGALGKPLHPTLQRRISKHLRCEILRRVSGLTWDGVGRYLAEARTGHDDEGKAEDAVGEADGGVDAVAELLLGAQLVVEGLRQRLLQQIQGRAQPHLVGRRHAVHLRHRAVLFRVLRRRPASMHTRHEPREHMYSASLYTLN